MPSAIVGDLPINGLYTTMRDNIQTNMAGISLNLLPRNFQDAVYLTRALGIDYLWIDCLCIIQATRKTSSENPQGWEAFMEGHFCLWRQLDRATLQEDYKTFPDIPTLLSKFPTIDRKTRQQGPSILPC